MEYKMSASCTVGHSNIEHNQNKKNRKAEQHIDNNRIDDNIILKKCENVEEEFNKIFEDDVAEYNSKQKRKDRQIKSYYQKVKNDKQIKAPYREIVLQIGNREDAKDPMKKEKMINCLQDFYRIFETRYPNLKVLSAVIHLDEATPHLHLSFVPVAENNKNGLKHKVNFEKSLEQMGFEPEYSKINKKEKEKPLVFNGFRNDCMRTLEDIMSNNQIQRRIMNNTKKHIEPAKYREKMAIEDLKKDPQIKNKAVEELSEDFKNFANEISKENNQLKEENEQLKQENNGLQWYESAYKKLQNIFAKIFKRDKNNETIEEIVTSNDYFLEDFKNEINKQSQNAEEDER